MEPKNEEEMSETSLAQAILALAKSNDNKAFSDPNGNFKTIVGPQGPQGEKGDKGEQGEKGEEGEEGLMGPRGLKGDKGEQGEKGDRGERGEKGTDGRNGRDGKDATIESLGKVFDLEGIESGRLSFNYLRNIPKSITKFEEEVQRIVGQFTEQIVGRTAGFFRDLSDVNIIKVNEGDGLVWDKKTSQMTAAASRGGKLAFTHLMSQGLVNGTNQIVHNLDLSVPKRVQVQVCDDATGALVTASITNHTKHSFDLIVSGTVTIANIVITA